MKELTVAIVAHNAERTIARAVESVRAAGDWPILLVADGCTDSTVDTARNAGAGHITIHELTPNRGVGAARAHALALLHTPYAMWLDADDEILPDRPAMMLEALKAGADIVYDEGVLVDDLTGQTLSILRIPDFLCEIETNASVRCFERNWYPLLHCGFRVSVAQKIGFDRHFMCAEDYDFLLRAIAGNAKIQPMKALGYKYYHIENTISRNLENTRKHVRTALEKHRDLDVEKYLKSSSLPEAEQYCVLAGSALYRGDPAASLEYASRVSDEACFLPTYNMSVGQYAFFVKASAYAAQGKWCEASECLDAFLEVEASADAWNNMGVALFNLDEKERADKAFSRALELMPGYMDATNNLAAKEPSAWTTHPLRRQVSRSNYG